METYILISVLSMMYSWTLCTALAVPAGETPAAANVTPGRHVRTKRCSCATFLDKECVYFCHLDIIWVNTPERVVSYGLGSAPRKRRAAAGAMATSGGPRCRCYRGSDGACRDFCRLEKQLRYGTPPDAVSRSAEGDGCAGAQSKQKLAADTGRIKRTANGGSEERVSPPAVGTAIRMLLERWRARQRRTS